MKPVRVVLVEDNDSFRETLELLFGLRDEIEVVGSVATGDNAPPIVAELKPDRAYLTHMSHELDYEVLNARLPAGVEMAYDGLKLEF